MDRLSEAQVAVLQSILYDGKRLVEPSWGLNDMWKLVDGEGRSKPVRRQTVAALLERGLLEKIPGTARQYRCSGRGESLVPARRYEQD